MALPAVDFGERRVLALVRYDEEPCCQGFLQWCLKPAGAATLHARMTGQWQAGDCRHVIAPLAALHFINIVGAQC